MSIERRRFDAVLRTLRRFLPFAHRFAGAVWGRPWGEILMVLIAFMHKRLCRCPRLGHGRRVEQRAEPWRGQFGVGFWRFGCWGLVVGAGLASHG